MTRWEKARQDTKGFRAWKREAFLGLGVGVTTLILLLVFGQDEAVEQEAIIVSGSIVGTILLVPLLEFGWNLLKAPDRLLRQEVRELQAEVQELTGLVRPEASKMRAVLKGLHEETGDALRLMRIANDRGIFWRVTEPSPRTAVWKKHRDFLADQRDMEALYEAGRLAAQGVDRVMGQRAARTFLRFRRDVQEEDRLPDVIASLEDFDRRLEQEITRLDQVRSTAS